ncbi:MAG: hypothetical protein GW913_04290 [Myxococcales bacterium]|nr:hypothetical protein [Myxococcales bacterium]
MSELLPWREDPDAPELLRRDLQRVVDHPLAFDVPAGLATLHGSIVFGRVFRLWPWLAFVGIGLGLGVALWPRPSITPMHVDRGVEPASATTAALPEPSGAAPTGPASATHEASPTPAAAPALPIQPSLEPDAAPAHVPVASPRDGEPPATTERVDEPDSTRGTQDETAHMALLRSTAAHDPRAALRMEREDSRLFRGGLFDEERQALRVLLLAQVGQLDSARRLGVRFLHAHPESAFAPRVRQVVTP